MPHERARESAEYEGDLLRREALYARSAAGHVARELGGDLRRAIDPRGWLRRYPWVTLTTVSAAGLAASWMLLPRRARKHSRSESTKPAATHRRPSHRPEHGSSGLFTKVGRRLLTAGVHAAAAGGASLTARKTVRDEVEQGTKQTAQQAASAPDSLTQRGEAEDQRSWPLLLKQTVADWSEDKAPRLGAALAYYTVFSLAPLLVISVALAGLFVDPDQAQAVMDEQVRGFLGEGGQAAVQAMVEGARKPTGGVIATVVGIVALLFGASGVFGQLQDALNTIWEVEPKPGRGVWGILRDRFLSFGMVLGIGFLLLVSLVLSSLITAAGNLARDLLPGPDALLHGINLAVSFGVVTLLFAAIFKLLPDVRIAWRDVWIGAAGTAVLFTIGKYLISLYLGYAAPESTYGAVGSLIAVLLWTYYSAQILLLGAEFTQAYARMYGSQIKPAANARRVTTESRARQGMPAR
jgi:membrane protein